MINKSEYTNILENSTVLNFFEYDKSLLEVFFTLRKMYYKYCREAYYHNLYPKVNINEDIAPYLIDIIRYCKQFEISCEYEKINRNTHEHGEYCKFFYKGVDITGIIDLYPGKKDFYKYN